jgi:hypothetical protein
MAFMNFLTQGTPLPSSTSSLTTQQVPQYLSDFIYNTLSGAYQAAQQEYQPYKGPRIADFTPEQLNAMQMVTGQRPSSAPKEWTPYGSAAGAASTPDGTASIFGSEYDAMADSSGAGVGYGPSSDYFATSAPSPLPSGGVATSYMPQLQAAEQTAAKSGALSTLGAAQPYFDKAGKTLPGVISDYMNPYQKNVIETMGTEAQRQLQEKILPAIGDQFTRAGQFGSSRQQEIAQRGVRDIASDLEANIGKQLAAGYTTAGTQAQNDLTRLASIGKEAGALTGTEEANKANLANIQAGLGQKAQTLGLTGAAAIEGIGEQQRAMNQKNLDLAYKDFKEQEDYPKEQIGWASNIVRGLPSGGGTTSQAATSVGNTYSASPLASLASAGLSAAAIGNLLGKG